MKIYVHLIMRENSANDVEIVVIPKLQIARVTISVLITIIPLCRKSLDYILHQTNNRVMSYAQFTPPDPTRQNCLVASQRARCELDIRTYSNSTSPVNRAIMKLTKFKHTKDK